LAGPTTTPLVGAKRSRSSDDEEALPQTSYQKQKDRRSFHPFRAMLMRDEELFQPYI
jgi:hypothetical protein